jgi:uncharacterized membrane protein
MEKEMAVDTPFVERAFKVSLWLKFADGVLECLGGVSLLFFKTDQLTNWVTRLTQHELSTDPHDFIATYLLNFTHQLTAGALVFGAFYLLSHGIIKIVLVIEVFRRHLWAYIGLIVVTAGFVIYQAYRLTLGLNVGLILLTAFDLIVIYLTQREYRKLKGKLAEIK